MLIRQINTFLNLNIATVARLPIQCVVGMIIVPTSNKNCK